MDKSNSEMSGSHPASCCLQAVRRKGDRGTGNKAK